MVDIIIIQCVQIADVIFSTALTTVSESPSASSTHFTSSTNEPRTSTQATPTTSLVQPITATLVTPTSSLPTSSKTTMTSLTTSSVSSTLIYTTTRGEVFIDPCIETQTTCDKTCVEYLKGKFPLCLPQFTYIEYIDQFLRDVKIPKGASAAVS